MFILTEMWFGVNVIQKMLNCFLCIRTFFHLCMLSSCSGQDAMHSLEVMAHKREMESQRVVAKNRGRL